MSEEKNNPETGAGLKDVELAAVAASATVLTFMLIYWIIQVQDMLDMLELAYG